MNKNYIVYKHTAPNGKIYIGQTGQKNPKRRWQNGEGYKPNAHFYNAIKKYGWDNFEHVIVADGLTKEEADWLEKFLIDYYETTDRAKGYNNTSGGDGSFEMTDEVKRKMSEARKGIKKSDEHRKHLSEANKRLGDFYTKLAAEKTAKIDSIIAENYDYTKSVKENHSKLLELGYSISEKRIYRWTKKNNIDTVKGNAIVLSDELISKYNPNLSIAKNMVALGVSEKTIKKIIKQLKSKF